MCGGDAVEGVEVTDRLRIAYVDERALLDFLRCWRGGNYVVLPVEPLIPPGCEIVRVWYSPERRAIAVMLSHPHFDPVPAGDPVPSLERFIEYEFLQRKPVSGVLTNEG